MIPLPSVPGARLRSTGTPAEINSAPSAIEAAHRPHRVALASEAANE